MFFYGLILIKIVLFVSVKSDNFPSLLTTNATLAVVIDREYLAENFETIRDVIEDYIILAKREIIKHGGVNVQYFAWTSINVKRDITAIFSIASCKDSWKLYRAASEEHILHMAISETDCPRMPSNDAFIVPLIKHGQELPQLLLDLRTAHIFKWTSAIILYDTTLDRDMVTRVITSLTKESSALRKNSAVSVIKLNTLSTATNNRQTIKEILETISTKQVGSNFLAIVSMETMEIIMDLAKSLGLVTPDNQWLYIVGDTNAEKSNISSVEKFLEEGDNVAFIYNTTLEDASCKSGLACHTREILEAFATSLESAILAEFELSSQVSDEEWEAIRPTKYERKTALLFNVKSHLVQYGSCDNCSTWRFQAGETWGKEFHRMSTKGSSNLLNVGSWRPSDGTAMLDELFPHVAHGFRGRNLPLITFNNPPWQILTLNESGSIQFNGIVFDIIRELAKNLNFTYTIEVLKLEGTNATMNLTNKYGVLEMTDLVTNIIPDKIVQLIRNKQVAMGAAAFTVTDHSKAIINFTMPISTQIYTFLVARPKELSRALLFMSPFTKDTWLCLAAAIVSMGPILYYIHKFSPVCAYKGISVGGLSSIQNCIWYMYGALLQQGGMHLPCADSARIIIGAWWLVVLVVATTYCGNLVAFLTFPKIDNPIATLDNLLSHKDTVTWSMSKGSYIESQFKETNEDKYRDLYKGATRMDLNSVEMLPLIQEGKHVFIDWKIRLQYIMRKQYLVTGKCDLALGSDEFLDEKIALIVAQGTPYLQKINTEIKRLHQNGLISKWLKDYLPKKDKCFKVGHVAEVKNHTVNMDDMQGSFFVLFFGFILALLIIIGEKLWCRYKIKKERKIIQPYIQ